MQNDNKVLIIAEAGVNHNGSIDTALKMCDVAKDIGVDVIKFQTYKTEKIITASVEQADYQKTNVGEYESQFAMLKELELSYDEFATIKKHCDEIGITFASTGDTVEDVEFLRSLGVPFIKIGSGDIGNIPLLRYIGSQQLPVIMSTGMADLDAVELSIRALKDGGAEDITLLHCTTNYPCPFDGVNLKAMDTLREEFNLPVGYSDHTIGMEVPVAAVARGAKIIEKHFTLSKDMIGPDHIASTEPEEFRQLVQAIRNVECSLGTGKKEPTQDEINISKVVLKRIVAKRDIPKGKIIEESDLDVKRSDSGQSVSRWDSIVGTVAKKDYIIDEGIEL